MKHDLTIYSGDIAIAALPTARTLRMAKALGFAAVLHHGVDFGWPDPVEHHAIRKRVEAARLDYCRTDAAQFSAEGLPTPAELAELIDMLAKPLLIVSRERASMEVLVDIALCPPHGRAAAEILDADQGGPMTDLDAVGRGTRAA